MRDAIQLEQAGKPTVTIAYDVFESAARAQASALGYPDLPLLVVPAPTGGNQTANPREEARQVWDLVVSGLTVASKPPISAAPSS